MRTDFRACLHMSFYRVLRGFPGVPREPNPLIKEYGLNYIGLHIMIYAIFLN